MEVHLKTLRFEYTRSSEHNSQSIDFFLKFCAHLNIPCLLKAFACLVLHLAVNIIQRMETVPRSVDFTAKSLLLFIVVGI